MLVVSRCKWAALWPFFSSQLLTFPFPCLWPFHRSHVCLAASWLVFIFILFYFVEITFLRVQEFVKVRCATVHLILLKIWNRNSMWELKRASITGSGEMPISLSQVENWYRISSIPQWQQHWISMQAKNEVIRGCLLLRQTCTTFSSRMSTNRDTQDSGHTGTWLCTPWRLSSWEWFGWARDLAMGLESQPNRQGRGRDAMWSCSTSSSSSSSSSSSAVFCSHVWLSVCFFPASSATHTQVLLHQLRSYRHSPTSQQAYTIVWHPSK